MFVVFYIVKIVYICVFMTCSTSCYLCDTHMDPWNVRACVCMYVCTYVCMYVYMHACMYLCMCVCMHACMHAQVVIFKEIFSSN
jgi:hypothetical protein